MRIVPAMAFVLASAFCANAETTAVATGSSAVIRPASSSVAAGEDCVFAYHNDRYSSLEASVYIRTKSATRIWYWFEDEVAFPIDVQPGEEFIEYQVIYGSSPIGEHTITFRPNGPVEIDRLEFYTTKTDVLPEGNDLTSLPPVDRKSRITVRDVGYVPETVGEAEVLLWKDDKVAAATMTVDDNHAEEIDWWLEKSALYGARITWFIIGENIGSGHPVTGSWSDYRKVLDAGHDVQSHSFTHLHDTEMTMTEEYTNNIAAAARNLSGHRIVAVAYPGGALTRKCVVKEAMKYHIGGRGATSFVNEAGKINYQSTSSSHGESTVLDANEQYGLSNLVVRNEKWPTHYRGWNCHHSHNLNAGEAVGDSYKEGVLRTMSFYAAHNVWMPGYADVLKYGQERDTARIETRECAEGRIVLNLTDKMSDDIFDHPLSVVLRVPDGWTGGVRVVQGGATNEVPVRTAGNKSSVMFDAVPDRGEIEIAPLASVPSVEPEDPPAEPEDPPDNPLDNPVEPPDEPVDPAEEGDFIAISNETDFVEKITSFADPSVSYRLVADLTLANWSPVDFHGRLNGAGHAIRGLAVPLFAVLDGTFENAVIDGEKDGRATLVSGLSVDFGLVAVTNCGGTVRHVVLRNFDVRTDATMYKNDGFFSAVAMDGATFESCTVEASCTFRNRASNIGGIAGALALSSSWAGPSGADLARFLSCTNRGELIASSSGGSRTGGMLGAASVASTTLLPRVTISNCVNFASFHADANIEAGGCLGGIVGERNVNVSQVPNGTLVIVDCANRGNLVNQGKTGCYYGGAIGHTHRLGGILITRFCNYGRIGSATSVKGSPLTNGFAGGIIGATGDGGTSPGLSAGNPIEVFDSANYGEVVGGLYAGGLISAVTPFDSDNTRCLFVNCANYGAVRTVVANGFSGQGIAFVPVKITSGATRVYGCENCFFAADGIFGEVTGTEMRSVGNVTADDAGYSPQTAVKALSAGARVRSCCGWGVGKVGGMWYPELTCFRTRKPGSLLLVR